MIRYNTGGHVDVDFGKNYEFDHLLSEKPARGRNRTNSLENNQNTIETQKIIAISNKYDKDYLLIAVDDQKREEDMGEDLN